jgi:hypothetical protein
MGTMLSVPTVHAEEGPFGDFGAALGPSAVEVQDRLALLNLIGSYSHLADGLHTAYWGEFFSEDAVFSIVPFAARGEPSERIEWKGREEILAAIGPRHRSHRRDGVQRRHFLTNPIVWDQTARAARVAVYLQLLSTTDGRPAVLVGTGRYEGRAVKTEGRWRMAEWTIYTDQHASAAGLEQK